MKKKQQLKKKTEPAPEESHNDTWRSTRIVVLGLFMIFLMYRFTRDWEFGMIVRNERPIEYTFISKKARYSHNPHYYMDIYFAHKYYAVQISKSEFDALKENIKPKLYYSMRYDQVFTVSEKYLMLSISVFISLMGFIGYWNFARFTMGDKPRISDFKDWRKFI